MMTFNVLILDPLKEMLSSVFSFLPTIITTLFLVTAGMILARLVSTAIHRVLHELKLDRILDKIGMKDLTHRGGVKHSISEIIGSFVYMILMVIVLLITVKYLGLTMVKDTVDKIFVYIPHVLSAVVVLILGIVVAKVVAGLVHYVASFMDFPKPKLVERITRWAIVILAMNSAIDELGFGSLLIGTTFQILFGAVCLGFALAYGLGGREVAAKHLAKYSKK